MKLFKEGLEKFLNSSGQDSKHFAVVISLQNGDRIPEMPVRVIEARDEQSKFGGMAASDYGVAVNGDIVNECAAFQLPTLVINDIHLWKAYFTLMYNSFGNLVTPQTAT